LGISHDHSHHHDHPSVVEHRSLGDGGLRAAVFGLSDGLVSNTALVLGVAAGAESGAVLLAGVAGLLAGAASMAAGEWISMTAQREALEQELAREQDHLDRYPEDERSHIQDILVKAGLTAQTAERVSEELADKPGANLDVHARVELGIDPGELGSPAIAALASFIAFGLGALIPLIPWVLPLGAPMLLTGLLSGAALFAAGAGLSRFTHRGALYSGARQLLVGVIAAALTMTIGGLVGVSV
jgi:VIT1/CCC1 family predicted Fe2+/Mn2+ transporter